MKNLIGMLLVGVIISLSSGEVMEWDGDCHVIYQGVEDSWATVYCSDYKDKGFHHPMIYSIAVKDIDQINLVKNHL